MRVLFATSDPNQPGAVGDALLARGYEWQVLAYSRPEEAREVLADLAADAVVVDLALDNAEALLRHMLHTAPGTARMVLCPNETHDVALRLLALTHGILSAKDSIEDTAEALIAYARLAKGLDRPELRAVVGALTRLPGVPKLYMAINRALDNPDVDISSVTQMIMADPVVSGRVLQLANSALFSGGRQVSSIAFAVTRLGLKTTRSLVLASELYALGGAEAARADRVRQQCLLASWLAPRLMADHVDPEIASTAALLAGIGQMLPELLLDEAEPLADVPPIEDEAAAYLLGLWQLPSVLQEAVAWQRTPRLSGARFGVVGAVHVATALAFDRPVDEAWLERCGVAVHLPGWRDLADRMERTAA